jgi:hypothetical protein
MGNIYIHTLEGRHVPGDKNIYGGTNVVSYTG